MDFYLLIIFPNVIVINTQSKDEDWSKGQVIENFISRHLENERLESLKCNISSMKVQLDD